VVVTGVKVSGPSTRAYIACLPSFGAAREQSRKIAQWIARSLFETTQLELDDRRARPPRSPASLDIGETSLPLPNRISDRRRSPT
jgi:hypothetical protein